MFLSVLKQINEFNETVFAPIDGVVESFPIAHWVSDAICDSLHLLPFLFFLFILVEIAEYYYADKINSLLKRNEKFAVPLGALSAIFPQCGFSVIASGLYSAGLITRGALIAVYLSTSDETIPILLASPNKVHLVVPIIGIKLFIGILAGYLLDFVFKSKTAQNDENSLTYEEGCCKHDLGHAFKRQILIHPVVHTANIFAFILIITLILNYCLETLPVINLVDGKSFIKPVIAGFVGLIPNCAVSIGFTVMLIKGTISFGTAMSGLLANSGLGLLVLLKKNDFLDTLKIVLILLIISILSGITINYLS